MSLRFLISAAAAAMIGSTALILPAQAQFGIELGIGVPREAPPRYYGRPDDRREVERRVYRDRRVVEDDEEECRFVMRRRVNRYGEVEMRRVRICE